MLRRLSDPRPCSPGLRTSRFRRFQEWDDTTQDADAGRSNSLEAISQLAAGPVAAAKHVFASAAAAAQVPLQRGGSGESSDLCTLSTVLLVSVPGLHASDLALLPSTHASPTGLRASLSAAAQKVQQLYLSASQIKRATLVRGVAKSFVNECGAVVQGGEEKSLWGGEAGKTMLFDRVDGMDELELTGAEARAARREVMLNVGESIASLYQHVGQLADARKCRPNPRSARHEPARPLAHHPHRTAFFCRVCIRAAQARYGGRGD